MQSRRYRDITGDDVLEVIAADRCVVFFIENNGQIGWIIASKPPHPRDGSGWIQSPSDWLTTIARGFDE